MDKPRLELTGSRLFTAWLASAQASLAFTTYQAGKLFSGGDPRSGAATASNGSAGLPNSNRSGTGLRATAQ